MFFDRAYHALTHPESPNWRGLARTDVAELIS
jgi:hypothetical protein